MMLEVSRSTTVFRTYLPGMTYDYIRCIIDLISSYVGELAVVDRYIGGTGKAGHDEDVAAEILI
jgi:hypothetical protein